MIFYYKNRKCWSDYFGHPNIYYRTNKKIKPMTALTMHCGIGLIFFVFLILIYMLLILGIIFLDIMFLMLYLYCYASIIHILVTYLNNFLHNLRTGSTESEALLNAGL